MKRFFTKNNRYDICLFSGYLFYVIALYYSLQIHDSFLAYNKVDIYFPYFYLQPVTFVVIGILAYVFLRVLRRLEQYIEVVLFNTILILSVLWCFSPSVIFISPLTKHLEMLCTLLAFALLPWLPCSRLKLVIEELQWIKQMER